MCFMCETNGGEMTSCQECGILICADIKRRDDVIAPAYVTAAGDVFCDRCGMEHDELDEYDPEMDFGDFDPYEEGY